MAEEELKWTLKQHGDDAERLGWPLLEDKFPNYEVFWSKFIVPMSCREVLPQGHPRWVQFRKGVDPDLQRIAMSHYTIFRSLLFVLEVIFRHKEADVQAVLPFTHSERIDNVYIYLGIIVDMTENLFWNLHRLRFRFGLEKNGPNKKLTRDEILERVRKYLDNPKAYDSDFEEFLKKKKPVAIKLHEIGDSLSLLKDEDLKRKFQNLASGIRAYRNAVIHNPQMGTVYDQLGEAWAPKKDVVKKYHLWGDLLYDANPSDFQRADEAMIHDFEKMCDLLNQCWNELVGLYEGVTRASNYKELLGSFPPLEGFYIPSKGTAKAAGVSGDGFGFDLSNGSSASARPSNL